MISAPNQVSIKPIEDFVFEGLVGRLHEMFGAHVVLTNATDEIQTLAKLKQQNVKYPYLFASVTTMGITKDSYRAAPWIRRGLDVFVSNDNLQVLKVSLLPTDFVMEIKYFHNDFPSIVKFAKRWLFASAAGWMKFTVVYGESLDIRVTLEETVSIPKREANPENVQEFPVVSSLTIQGWSSEEKLRNQSAVVQVDVDSYLSELAQQQGTTFFSFIKKWNTPTLPDLGAEVTATSGVGTNDIETPIVGSLSLVSIAPTITNNHLNITPSTSGLQLTSYSSTLSV